MKAAKFNKSEIMKQAWSMYRNTFFHYTFSQALRMAWYYAKQEAERIAKAEARKAEQAAKAAMPKEETKRDRFYKNFNRRNNAAYRNVRFGRSDWAVDYRRY